MRRLLHRVDDVVPPEGEARDRLHHERPVEEHLPEGGAGLHPPHREARAPDVADPLDGVGLALGEGEEVDLVPEPGEGAHELENRQRRAPDLEERLRGEEEDPQ